MSRFSVSVDGKPVTPGSVIESPGWRDANTYVLEVEPDITGQLSIGDVVEFSGHKLEVVSLSPELRVKYL